MDHFWCFLALTAVFTAAGSDDACPGSKEIAPCTCDGEGMSCLGPVTLEQMQKAFKADFKYRGIRAIWIQATPITTISQNLFNNITVQEAHIEMNNLTSMDLKSLMGAKNHLFVLSLYGNKLKTFDYEPLSAFQRLSTLNLANNELTSIPKDAFQSQILRMLMLTQNKITSIGERAFEGLSNLMTLELSLNKIQSLGPLAVSFRNNMPQIGLVSNLISNISKEAFGKTTPQILRLADNKLTSLPFDVFVDLVVRMGQHDALLDVSANPFTCKGCDYSWLVTNKGMLSRVLVGFACTDGRNLESLTHFNIGC